MSILVCGGAGYIGSHCVKALVEKGYDVVVIDSLVTGHRKSVFSKAHFYQVDIGDIQEVVKIIKQHKVEACIHFAAYSIVPESVKDPLKYYENNVYRTLRLLKALEQTDVKYLVFSSTAAVYGEADVELITEQIPTNPVNPYGETKLSMEKMIRWHSLASGLRYISLRYFNVCGAALDASIGEDHHPETHLIPKLIEAARNNNTFYIFGDDYDTPDGTCIRDYIHVMDLVEAHILALESLKNGAQSNVYNLGYAKGFSVKQIVEKVKQRMPSLDVQIKERREGDPARLVASNDRIVKDLGFKPKFDSIEQIIDSAWQWHQTNPKGYDDENILSD